MSNFLVLELGSKSLKIHRKGNSGCFEKVSVPWSLGHEVYREGQVSSSTRQRVSEVVQRLESRGFRKEGMLAIGTGAVRDAEDRESFIRFLEDRLKIGVRILTGREEASLLAQGFLAVSRKRPALVLDIGGGSLEMVYLDSDRTLLRDSLPLGAIRLHYLGFENNTSFNISLVEEFIEGVLKESSVIQIPVIHGTGGPLKAISRVLGESEISLPSLDSLEEQVRREGPPDSLSERRRPIFLPGVMVMRRLLRHCRAERLCYQAIPIGRIFLERFLGQTRPELPDGDNARLLTNLRITSLLRRKDSRAGGN